MTAIFLFFIGLAFAYPFLRTPPDDHFANYASWALFREPGARLPAHYIQLNQGGFTRMFLYPLAVLVHDLFGRDNLLVVLRWISAGINSAVGVALYGIAVHQLGVESIPAIVGAILYLFISTRPQYELLKYNPEVFQVLGEVLGVGLLLILWPIAVDNWWVIALPIAWLVFVSLNCKILFGINAFAMAIAIWVMSGYEAAVLAAIMIGGLAGAGLFFFLITGVSPKRLVALKGYLSLFAKQNVRANFKWNYTHLYSRTPLLAYGVLSGMSLLLGLGTPFFPLFVLWSLAAVSIVVIQKRFCSYFFLIAFAPLGFLGIVGLNRLFIWHPVLMVAAVLGLCWLGRKSLAEFPGYYRAMLPRELVDRIHGHMAWVSSYDFRVEDVVVHNSVYPGPFMLWQTNLLAHYLTGQAPIVLAGTMIYDSQIMFPKRQSLLIAAARRERPQWLYDFGGSHQGLLNFNPVSFLCASGLKYVPRKRWHNVVYYELSGVMTPVWQQSLHRVQLYVIGSVVLDTLRNQMLQADIAPCIPEFYDRDIAYICQDLLNGNRNSEPLDLPDAMTDDRGVVGLYAAAAAVACGDSKKARQFLMRWEHANEETLEVFPALGVSVLALQCMAECPEASYRWPKRGFAACTGVHEGLPFLELAQTMLSCGAVCGRNAARLRDVAGSAHVETDINRYFKINEYNALLRTLTKSSSGQDTQKGRCAQASGFLSSVEQSL